MMGLTRVLYLSSLMLLRHFIKVTLEECSGSWLS